jgi:hypothetical protein
LTDPWTGIARPDRGTDSLVDFIQDRLIPWAAVELVDACRRTWLDAERLLGTSTVLGVVSAGEQTFFMRTVRESIYVIAESFRRHHVSSQLPLPFDGLTPALRYERDWREYYQAELVELLREPGFVRNTLIATLHPDTELQYRCTHAVLALLYRRYCLPFPPWLAAELIATNGETALDELAR